MGFVIVWFTFDGPDRVTLRIDPPELTPPVVESLLVWERVRRRDGCQ
jgi:hypothetical protein